MITRIDSNNNYFTAFLCSLVLTLVIFSANLIQQRDRLREKNSELTAAWNSVAQNINNLDNKLKILKDQAATIDTQTATPIFELLEKSGLDLTEDRDLYIESNTVKSSAPSLSTIDFTRPSKDVKLTGVIDGVARISANIAILENKIAGLADEVGSRTEFLKGIPVIAPVYSRMTSAFGMRQSPTYRKQLLHKGVDLSGKVGTPIRSPAEGVVSFYGFYGGYGRLLAVDHGNGFETRYAHLSKAHVKPGDIIERGQLLAEVGNTGRTTGPHLHYEIWYKGRIVDPETVAFKLDYPEFRESLEQHMGGDEDPAESL